MDIYDRLLKYRYIVAAAIVVSSCLALSLAVLPHITSILSFFWPLILSTALVLVAVVVIGQMSPIPREFSGDREGKAFMDYVAGDTEFMEQY